MSSNITELLAAILSAKYGEEVRGSIHDAIELCYADGKAGVNDLEARRLIEAVAAVNESQEADIEALTARVEELEQGEGGGRGPDRHEHRRCRESRGHRDDPHQRREAGRYV